MRRRDVLRAGLGVGVGGVVVADRGRLLSARASAADGYEPLGRLDLPGAKEAVVGEDGATVFVATTDGFAAVDVADPKMPRVLTERRRLFADREGGPLRQVYDVTVDGDRLLVVGPAHGLGSDALNGAAVYDVSDPAAPELTGFHETDFPIHNADLADGFAYLTGNDGRWNPLVVVDVRDKPTEVGRWSLLDHDDSWSAVHPNLRSLHDVSVRDGRATLAHWDAGTWLLDVRDPESPRVLGHTPSQTPSVLRSLEAEEVGPEGGQLPGNDHYSALNGDGTLLGVGREAWDYDPDDGFEGGPGGVELYDVSDPADPRLFSTLDPPRTPDPTPGGVLTTAHNFAFAGDRLYTSWYEGGVKLHDVSDPANPVELVWWRDPETTSFWTAQRAATCVVASSFRDGVNGAESGAALYTFPDRPGEQANAPVLVDGGATVSSGSTRTRAPTDTTGGLTTSGSPALTTPRTPTTRTDSPGAPGFGPLVALSALGLCEWVRGRRR